MPLAQDFADTCLRQSVKAVKVIYPSRPVALYSARLRLLQHKLADKNSVGRHTATDAIILPDFIPEGSHARCISA